MENEQPLKTKWVSGDYGITADRRVYDLRSMTMMKMELHRSAIVYRMRGSKKRISQTALNKSAIIQAEEITPCPF